jgi:hypothetical protein
MAEIQLSHLATHQKRYFTWLCTVRALPFLSVKRNFGYWDESERKKYLQTIFYALDRILWYNNSFSYAYAAEIEGSIIARTLNAASRAAHDSEAAIAANVVNAVTNAIQSCAANTAGNAACVNPELRPIMLQDLDAIRENRLNTLQNDMSIYGDVWRHFQQDLTAIGCGYWAKLYAGIFKGRFYFDMKSLKRRINVPLADIAIPKDYGGKGGIANWILNNIRIDQKLFFISGNIKQEITERGEVILNDFTNSYTFNAPVGSVDRHDAVIDNSTNTANYFNAAAVSELRDVFAGIAQALTEQGELEYAGQARVCAGDLSGAAQCATPAEAKKKGFFKRTGEFLEKMGDKESALYRTVEGMINLSDKTSWLITKAVYFFRIITG